MPSPAPLFAPPPAPSQSAAAHSAPVPSSAPLAGISGAHPTGQFSEQDTVKEFPCDIVVHNIAKSVPQEGFQELLHKLRLDPKGVRYLRPRHDSQAFKGSAFVYFHTPKAAQHAINTLHGMEVASRLLTAEGRRGGVGERKAIEKTKEEQKNPQAPPNPSMNPSDWPWRKPEPWKQKFGDNGWNADPPAKKPKKTHPQPAPSPHPSQPPGLSLPQAQLPPHFVQGAQQPAPSPAPHPSSAGSYRRPSFYPSQHEPHQGSWDQRELFKQARGGGGYVPDSGWDTRRKR